MNGLDAAFWEELLTRINAGEVVPVVGPGAVTVGNANELLYPWLARRLPAELDPPLVLEAPPRDLQEVVDAQRARAKPVGRIYRRLHQLVEDPALRPGESITSLASIDGFQLFISTTFDSLLPRAVREAWPGGKLQEREGAMTLRGPCPELPHEIATLQYKFVYQVLGRSGPTRDFVVWDDDVLPFLLLLDRQLPELPKLSEALQKSHFLVLGLSLADLLLRFFVQVVKRQPLSELAGTELFISEQLDPAERAKVVVYFGRLTTQIRILPVDPIEFIATLHQEWRKRYPKRVPADPDQKRQHRDRHRAPCCMFVSYASTDLDTAANVVDQLQSAGCTVWFDKQQIQPGENWEEVLREAVEQRCGLFLSLISDNTAAKLEGYTIFERKLAARRQERFSDSAVFYLPVRIDHGEPLIPDNEPRGTKTLQAVRKPEGQLDAGFIDYLRDLQRANCRSLGHQPPE